MLMPSKGSEKMKICKLFAGAAAFAAVFLSLSMNIFAEEITDASAGNDVSTTISSSETISDVQQFSDTDDTISEAAESFNEADVDQTQDVYVNAEAAAVGIAQVTVTIGENIVTVNYSSFDTQVAPYIQEESGSAMVPLRVAALAVCGEDVSNDNSDIISWNSASKTASINYKGKTIQFTAGSKAVIDGGVPMVMENNAKSEIKNDRMFIPFRELGKALGADVQWNDDNTAVIRVG